MDPARPGEAAVAMAVYSLNEAGWRATPASQMPGANAAFQKLIAHSRAELLFVSCQRDRDETRQRQNQFCERHKLIFRLSDTIQCVCLFLGTSQLRVALYEFLLGTQPIFDVVAILPAT